MSNKISVRTETLVHLIIETSTDDLKHSLRVTDKIVKIDADRFYQLEKDYNERLRQDEELRQTAALNNKGIEFEKSGDIDRAIEVYEKNIAIGIRASHSFDRLRVIYKRKKDFESMERVIKREGEVYFLNKFNSRPVAAMR